MLTKLLASLVRYSIPLNCLSICIKPKQNLLNSPALLGQLVKCNGLEKFHGIHNNEQATPSSTIHAF